MPSDLLDAATAAFLADGTLAAAFGASAYRTKAPGGTDPPYAVLSSESRRDLVTSDVTVERATLRIRIYAGGTTPNGAAAAAAPLAAAVESQLKGAYLSWDGGSASALVPHSRSDRPTPGKGRGGRDVAYYEVCFECRV